MSRTLLLMRHGTAGSGVGIADADRSLTPEGAEDVKKVATGLRSMGFSGCTVVCSPLLRALETANIVATVLTPGSSPRECRGLMPSVRPDEAFSELVLAAGRAKVVLAASHMPTVAEFALWLTRDIPGATPRALLNRGFSPAAVACIDFEDEWGEGRGALRWFRAARELAPAQIPTNASPNSK